MSRLRAGVLENGASGRGKRGSDASVPPRESPLEAHELALEWRCAEASRSVRMRVSRILLVGFGRERQQLTGVSSTRSPLPLHPPVRVEGHVRVSDEERRGDSTLP